MRNRQLRRLFGNEFFDRVSKIITQKVIEEVNINKKNSTEIDVSAKMAHIVPVSLQIKNISLEDFKFIEDEIEIKHTLGDEISFKISKIIIMIK